MDTQQNEKDEKITIPLILGEETRPKIETFTNDRFSVKIENSIFYKQPVG